MSAVRSTTTTRDPKFLSSHLVAGTDPRFVRCRVLLSSLKMSRRSFIFLSLLLLAVSFVRVSFGHAYSDCQRNVRSAASLCKHTASRTTLIFSLC